MCTINQDHVMYGSWDIKSKKQSFLSFCHFLPFDPPNNPKNQNFEKMKKKPLEIIITLHKYTINDNHMIYGSRDINCKRQIFFCHLRPFFPHFTPLTAQKLKSSKNEKNTRRYHHFPQVYQKS